MSTDPQRKCFTITWRIENYDFCLEDAGNWIYSRWFLVDTLEGSKWRLGMISTLRNTKHSIPMCIQRHENSGISDVIELDYRFCVYSDHCSLPLFQVTSSHAFQKRTYSSLLFVPKAEVFEIKENKYILPDIQIIQCKFWRKEGSMSENGECTLKSEAQVERVSFVGVVEDFSKLTCKENNSIRIRSASDESSFFPASIGITNEGSIFIEVSSLNYEKLRVCHCVLYLLDKEGNEIEYGRDKFLLLNKKLSNVWKIPLNISKRNLMEVGNQYMIDDCLYLLCEFTYSTGKCSSSIIKTKYTPNLLQSIEQTSSRIQNNVDADEKQNSFMSTVQDDLILLYSSGKFSDTKLQTTTETFPAHKLILSVRSPAFSDLFANNMGNKINDCVQIECLDAETVRRLLSFLYSDSLKDPDAESAKKLYLAGDKYGILELKYKCSKFLQTNLCLSNCCDILLLADEHNDFDLKREVQKYIAHNDKEVLPTNNWKHLEKTNPVLSLETFHIMYRRNRKNS